MKEIFFESYISKKFYKKINEEISKKNLTYKEVAEKIGTSSQNFSDQMKNLKSGKFTSIRFLFNIQVFLGINLIFFCAKIPKQTENKEEKLFIKED